MALNVLAKVTTQYQAPTVNPVLNRILHLKQRRTVPKPVTIAQEKVSKCALILLSLVSATTLAATPVQTISATRRLVVLWLKVR